MRFALRVSAQLLPILLLSGVACNKTARDAAASDSVAPAPATNMPPGVAYVVEVTGLDYAFGMPDSVDAGRTAFKFTNKGKVDHEYNVAQLRPGVTIQQYIDAVNKQQPLDSLRDGPLGVLFASPGRTSASVMSADLLPGRTYAVQCIFRDSATAPSHRELGMFKAFNVRNNTAPTVAAVAYDSIVGTDYAYTKYPRTLTPGWHHLVFTNAGKQRHEINVALMKVGVTLKQLAAASDAEASAMLDEPLGVLHAEAGKSPLASLDFEVLPGREYVLICTFSDTPKSPPHFLLGMVTSMVSSK